MLDRIDSTIVAVSTAPGWGRLGIVRLNGPNALATADLMCRTASGEPLSQRPPSTRVEGDVFIDETLILPATFYVFCAPHSYTRQDMVEIHTVGAPAALALVRNRAVALGAMDAEPGEFTARAFLNGAMDLNRAEAVAAVIRAESDTQLRAARRMMDGDLSNEITRTRNDLSELVALVEADIDFAEEPIEFITPAALRERLTSVRQRLDALVCGGTTVERCDALPRILLFGPPNAGKSSLMNQLCGTNRAICAAAAGTTRDILSAPIRVGRGEALLLDTAGIDKSEDEIIAEARARAISESERVDLICVVVDVSRAADDILARIGSLDVPGVVVAANKCDLLDEGARRGALAGLRGRELGAVIPVSALRGEGIDDLRRAFAEALADASTTVTAQSVMVTERQRRAIEESSMALFRAGELSETALETVDCAELVAFELREALDLLGGVTGEVTTEDLLRQVFARFCVGK